MLNKKTILIAAIVILLFMATQSQAAELISKFEGLSLKPYLDSNGKWSIGYGTQYNWDAKRYVLPEDRITKETALKWLKLEIAQRQDAIKKLVKVPVTQNELDSLTSLAYNIGLGNFQLSTLLKKLNAKRPKAEIAKEFLKWNKVKGVVNDGLTKRRQLESELFLK
jgi:lysozyme